MISHEYGFMLVHIPFTGSKSLEEDYVKRNHEFVIASSDTKKLAKELTLEGNQLAKTIKQFYDYDLFAIVKSPYLRAVEMWINAQPKLRECGVGRLTLGNYYENLLNKWKFAPDDKIDKQIDYLKSINGMYFDTEVDVNVKHLFKYEFLVEGNMVELNEFLKSLGANGLPFYYDPNKLDDTWDEYYDDHAIEMVNYIFADDFEICGYSKL